VLLVEEMLAVVAVVVEVSRLVILSDVSAWISMVIERLEESMSPLSYLLPRQSGREAEDGGE